jgi:hypothetical protein
MTATSSHLPTWRSMAFRQPKRRALACAAALLLLSPGLLASSTGYYRWVDDKGAPQFTQKPPTDRPSEFVRTATGTSSRVEPGSVGQDQSGGNAAAPETAAKAPTGPIQGVPDKDPVKCQETRNTLSILNSSARIREKGADGEYRYLTPKQIAEQKRLADEAIKIYCD